MEDNKDEIIKYLDLYKGEIQSEYDKLKSRLEDVNVYPAMISFLSIISKSKLIQEHSDDLYIEAQRRIIWYLLEELTKAKQSCCVKLWNAL